MESEDVGSSPGSTVKNILCEEGGEKEKLYAGGVTQHLIVSFHQLAEVIIVRTIDNTHCCVSALSVFSSSYFLYVKSFTHRRNPMR